MPQSNKEIDHVSESDKGKVVNINNFNNIKEEKNVESPKARTLEPFMGEDLKKIPIDGSLRA